jgi:hypothetical protein
MPEVLSQREKDAALDDTRYLAPLPYQPTFQEPIVPEQIAEQREYSKSP